MIDRALLFVLRFRRAWRYYRQLRYSWHLAWHKAHWQAYP
jgi:hypothetical protein